MTAQTATAALALPVSRRRARWRSIFHGTENWITAIALAGLTIVPLLEIALRKTLHNGIYGASTITQHLTLIVGIAGAAAAARENRLITLSNVSTLLKGRMRTYSVVFSNAVAATITAFLFAASMQFLMVEREAGQTLAYGVPVWVVESVMPIGFAVIAVRLLWHSGETRCMRAVAAAAALALAAAVYLPTTSGHGLVPALAALLVATVIGVPAYVTLGGVALILFWAIQQPIASIPIAHYSLVTNPSLPALPLFTLAGYFLAEGQTPQRLVRVFRALFGSWRGGPAIVTVLGCAFFTCFTGASGMTIVALGGLLMPVLVGAGYSERRSLGLLTGSGAIGLLFPPCLPLILYAIIARVPIEKMFLGGIVPGIVMSVAICVWGVIVGNGRERQEFSLKEARASLWAAKWELLLPVVVFGALFTGMATPVEAAALTALYAFVVQTVIHRDLHIFRDAPRVMAECGLLVGGVLIILGVALGLTNYMVDAEVTTRLLDWTTASIHSRWVFLLALNVFFVLVGCLMDIFSAIVVQVPILVPMAAAFGINPVHLGIVFLANLELGYITPPVGLNLFMSSYRFEQPILQVLRAVLPIIVVQSVVVLLITYIPVLTTTLPEWLAK
jgi:tripartite ATP-independent transporter DctM subunit